MASTSELTTDLEATSGNPTSVTVRSDLRRCGGGYLGFAALPLLLALDTAVAHVNGWKPNPASIFDKLYWLAIAGMIAIGLPLPLRRYRQWLARHARQFFLASSATLLALLFSQAIVPWFVATAGFHLRPPGTRYRYDPDYALFPGVAGPATSSINFQGLRAAERPPSQGLYRILCLGGNTTECNYLDDSETWPTLLMKEINADRGHRVLTATAAVSEYGVGHHWRFVARAPLVDDFDCLVVLAGVNDLMRAMVGLDGGEAAPPLWLRCQPLELAKQIWNVRLQRGLILDFDGSQYMHERRQRPMQMPQGGLDLARAVEAYDRRLRGLIRAARSRRKRLVLVTQPTLWDDFLDPAVEQRLVVARTFPDPRPWTLLRPGACREAMDRFNLRLLKVAAESHTECVDAAVAMSGDAKYFYDDYHLNEEGCRQLAKVLAESRKLLPPPPRESR